MTFCHEYLDGALSDFTYSVLHEHFMHELE